MFAHAPRLVQQRPVAPHIYERTPSHVPPLAPRSRAPSLHQSQSPTVSLPFPTRQPQAPIPPPPRPGPELWIDALKDDVEAEFNLNLVDDVKAAKDAALAAATRPEERAAIVRVYDESMADIKAQARAEFQRRVEAERERRLLGNYDGKDALIAEQHSILESIMRDNMRRDASQQSSTAAPPPFQTPTPIQAHLQSHPSIARPSQPIPIPIQRNRSRNGGPSGSVPARSVSFTSSSSPSSRPFPSTRRDSVTQHASPRLQPPPVSSASSSASSVSSIFEPSSSSSSFTDHSDRRYEEHRAVVQKREEDIKRKEAAARRFAEEARRREEAAARREQDARRKDEEATRRIRMAEQREQQVLALEARTRKEMELAGAVRGRTQSQTQNAAAPLISKMLSKVEVWQPKPRSVTADIAASKSTASVVVNLVACGEGSAHPGGVCGSCPEMDAERETREGSLSCGARRLGCLNRYGSTFYDLSLLEREQAKQGERPSFSTPTNPPFVRREATGVRAAAAAA
ncbi:hypothetical protein BC827DRAFT_1156256 [Russula dissimulans]|nr:hypothetical protein BC827DRAFT_1156256 [Russula dissimulans]